MENCNCNHTHEFEKIIYIDCPWCTCDKYNGDKETSGLYFRPARSRSARRRKVRESGEI